jgi:predicted GH43/DUF377 family glycosyl hydrolase
MSSVQVEPILAESVLLEPVNDTVYPGASKAEACGLQDPRITYNPADMTYYMTFCVYSDPLPKDPKTNPLGIKWWVKCSSLRRFCAVVLT